MDAYSEFVTGSPVPLPTRERRDRTLEVLRAAMHCSLRACDIAPLVEGSNYGLACKDLGELERFGLVRSAGHPRRWTAC